LPGLFKEFERTDPIDSILTCGPEPMEYKVVEEAEKREIPSQVSLERIIKCSVGICGSCDLGGYRTCGEWHIAYGRDLLKTEFGKFTRDKTGSRVPVSKGDKEVLPISLISPNQLEPLTPRDDPLLEMEIAGVYFPNTTMNASGSGFATGWLYRLVKSGAGAVATKSIGPEPRKGYSSAESLCQNIAWQAADSIGQSSRAYHKTDRGIHRRIQKGFEKQCQQINKPENQQIYSPFSFSSSSLTYIGTPIRIAIAVASLGLASSSAILFPFFNIIFP